MSSKKLIPFRLPYISRTMAKLEPTNVGLHRVCLDKPSGLSIPILVLCAEYETRTVSVKITTPVRNNLVFHRLARRFLDPSKPTITLRKITILTRTK